MFSKLKRVLLVFDDDYDYNRSKDYNTTIPSSAPIERFFSKALIVFTPRRNRILSYTFEKVLLYKHNKDVLNES